MTDTCAQCDKERGGEDEILWWGGGREEGEGIQGLVSVRGVCEDEFERIAGVWRKGA